MAQITYADKTYVNQNASVPAINKVQDTDMNEIKTVVNNTVSSIGTGNDTFSSSTAYSSGDLVIYQNQLYKFNASHNGNWTGNDVDLIPIVSNLTINPELLQPTVLYSNGNPSQNNTANLNDNLSKYKRFKVFGRFNDGYFTENFGVEFNTALSMDGRVIINGGRNATNGLVNYKAIYTVSNTAFTFAYLGQLASTNSGNQAKTDGKIRIFEIWGYKY